MARSQYSLPAEGKPDRSDPRGLSTHIRETAKKYGVDPEVALKVAKSEGLRDFLGDNGKSGGAFQLYTGGGLGNKFKKETGLDPLDPKNEKATIDYALREASKGGWGPWYGAAKVGVGKWDGIGGAGATTTTEPATTDTGDKVKGADTATTTTPAVASTTAPGATEAPAGDFLDRLKDPKGQASTGLGEAISGLGQAVAGTGLARDPYATTTARAPVPLAPLPPPPTVAPMVDPRVAENQRQQLALAMQRLNSGRLY
jgi:hypothetical protein